MQWSKWLNALGMLRLEEGFKVTLDFKVLAPTKLKDLRVSILPLLLEKSSVLGKHVVEMRSWQTQDGGTRLVNSHVIEFQQL